MSEHVDKVNLLVLRAGVLRACAGAGISVGPPLYEGTNLEGGVDM